MIKCKVAYSLCIVGVCDVTFTIDNCENALYWFEMEQNTTLHFKIQNKNGHFEYPGM